MAREKKRSIWRQAVRRVRFALFVMPLRSRDAAEYVARGVAIGIFWAFTPLIPFQTSLLGLTWIALRRFPRLAFSPMAAMAWVLVTNAATLAPVYFVFYVTGRLMLGHGADLLGYQAFHDAVGASAGDWAETAAALGPSVRKMPSGAGHDAQMFAPNCPTAMVFVPSKDGISHNVREFTDPKEIRAGADVLLQVMLQTAE